MAVTVAALADRARVLAQSRNRRVLIAVVGAPGAGKSTLAEALVDALGSRAALVPMDGFHYSQRILEQLGRSQRKGAPDTFDTDGLASLIARIRTATAPIYAPTFDRTIEEPIAAATVIPTEADIVVVEGNYLLLDGPWAPLRPLFDESWFLRVPSAVRFERLVQRHMRFGRSESAARAWAEHVDQPNARLIESTSALADLRLDG
jgi:pantothenate kinase